MWDLKSQGVNLLLRTSALLLALFAFSSCSDYQSGQSEASAEDPVDLSGLDTAIHASVDYLVRQVKDDGMFIYAVNMNPAVEFPERYNILRHAGTIYSMTMYQERFAKPEVMDAISGAVAYLRQKAMAPVDKERRLAAVWSIPQVNKTGSPLEAKLGGNGLGLVALCSYQRLKPGSIPIEELQSLGNFILYMQKEDGSFFSKFIPEKGGRNDEWVSLYYPGEAALGLVMLYELDPREEWLVGASKALNYLAQTRRNEPVVPADHWALLATERLLRLDVQLPVSSSLLIHHAKQIVSVMLTSQNFTPGTPELHGAFTPDGRTTPASTRLEGLLAAHEFMPDELPIHAYIATGVPLGIEFLLNAQVSEGDFAGGFPRSTRLMPGNSPEVIRSNARSTEIRIDYVQHALSALLQYRDILAAE